MVQVAANPVHDYITDVDTRCALFDEFRAICYRHDLGPNAAVAALFMIVPIQEISRILEYIRDFHLRGCVIRGMSRFTVDAIRACALISTWSLFFPGTDQNRFPLQIRSSRGRVCPFWLGREHLRALWSIPPRTGADLLTRHAWSFHRGTCNLLGRRTGYKMAPSISERPHHPIRSERYTNEPSTPVLAREGKVCTKASRENTRRDHCPMALA